MLPNPAGLLSVRTRKTPGRLSSYLDDAEQLRPAQFFRAFQSAWACRVAENRC